MESLIIGSKNPRINITFKKGIASLLSQFAHQNHQSMESLVRDLTLESLERREDLYLSKLAKKLDQEGAKTYSHLEAWE